MPLGSAPGNQWRASVTHTDLMRVPSTPHPITVLAKSRAVIFDFGRAALCLLIKDHPGNVTGLLHGCSPLLRPPVFGFVISSDELSSGAPDR